MRNLILIISIIALSFTAKGQITVEGPILNPAFGVIQDPWGREIPIDLKGWHKIKRYRVTIDDVNQIYNLKWTCGDTIKTLTIYTHTPPCMDIREWVYVAACDETMPNHSVVYFSISENRYVHRPFIQQFDLEAFKFYHINLKSNDESRTD